MAACSDTANKSMDDIQSPPKTPQSAHPKDSKPTDITALAKSVSSSSHAQMNTSCVNLNLQTLSGFTDTEIEENCQPVSNFQLRQFTCSVSENGFGANLDAFNLQTAQLSVYAYRSLKDCHEAVDTRNANGY